MNTRAIAQAHRATNIHFLPGAAAAPVAQAKRRGVLPQSVTSLLRFEIERSRELREAELLQRADDATDAKLSAYEECERLKRQLVSIATKIGEASARYEAAYEASVDATTALREFKAQQKVGYVSTPS